MREIKFRQPLFANSDLKFVGFHYWGILEKDKFVNPRVWDWEQDDHEGKSINIAQYAEKSQQFTGLKDMLGKEIWEGDIVKTQYSCFSGVDSFTGVVMYFEESTQFRLSNHNASTIFDMRHNVNYVQGNIYDNPELVKP